MMNAPYVIDESLSMDEREKRGIEWLIRERDEAKLIKDFEDADKIRSVLFEAGVILEDTPAGTTWRRK